MLTSWISECRHPRRWRPTSAIPAFACSWQTWEVGDRNNAYFGGGSQGQSELTCSALALELHPAHLPEQSFWVVDPIQQSTLSNVLFEQAALLRCPHENHLNDHKKRTIFTVSEIRK
jgi:hypothetical protein